MEEIKKRPRCTGTPFSEEVSQLTVSAAPAGVSAGNAVPAAAPGYRTSFSDRRSVRCGPCRWCPGGWCGFSGSYHRATLSCPAPRSWPVCAGLPERSLLLPAGRRKDSTAAPGIAPDRQCWGGPWMGSATDLPLRVAGRAARSGLVRAAPAAAELKVACRVAVPAAAWVVSLGRLLGIVQM